MKFKSHINHCKIPNFPQQIQKSNSSTFQKYWKRFTHFHTTTYHTTYLIVGFLYYMIISSPRRIQREKLRVRKERYFLAPGYKIQRSSQVHWLWSSLLLLVVVQASNKVVQCKINSLHYIFSFLQAFLARHFLYIHFFLDSHSSSFLYTWETPT